MACIYCAGRRRNETMSLEHIWPESLGGASAPPIFKTRDVCQKCNSNCGLFVDGAFLKSWFNSVDRVSSAHSYLDPQQPCAAPFAYWGIDTDFPVAEGDVCERWVGLAGEQVYHVHRKDDDRWSPYAGGDIIRRNADPGRAYIWLTSPTAYWSLTALMSFVAQFPTTERRCMTRIIGLPSMPIAMPFDLPRTAQELSEVEWLNRYAQVVRHMPGKVAVQIDFSDRFLAKLSLGIGHTVLGPSVSTSPYADELRKLLWSRDINARADIRVYGSGFWDVDLQAHVPNILKWEGAWCLLLTGLPVGFGLSLSTPSGRFMSMLVSDDPSLVAAADIDSILLNGAVFLFVPQRKKVIGPVPIFEFIAHRLGSKRSDLTELEQMRSTLASLPLKNTSRRVTGKLHDSQMEV